MPDEKETCPYCGLEWMAEDEPGVYTCPTCNKEGFDCCVGGNNVICFDRRYCSTDSECGQGRRVNGISKQNKQAESTPKFTCRMLTNWV